MIKLFDWLNSESLDLNFSLECSGFEGTCVVITDDGFLPDDMTSPYSFFCGMTSDCGKPLYFNQVPIPKLWQITGTNNQAEIWNHVTKKATIYYHQASQKRIVKNVDWLDTEGKVRKTDHYNKFGWIFARTYFDENQHAIFKKYQTRDKKEVLVENLVTGFTLLNWGGKTYVFRTKMDLLYFYFKEAGLNYSSILYNSLATSFLTSFYLQESGRDILFWQEDIQDTIPGNMKLILDGKAKRTQQIIIQHKDAYERLISLLSPEQAQMVCYLGYIYPNRRQTQSRKEILILTNSDQITQLDYLVSKLPDYHFHIAALTEMSQHLMNFGKYSNVHLYQNISQADATTLFDMCDIYLDINQGNEILDAIRTAFEMNMLILAFDTTQHNPSFVVSEHVFSASHPELMVKCLLSHTDLSDIVEKQRLLANQESKEHYQDIIRLGETND